MQGTSADPFRRVSGCCNSSSNIKGGRSSIAECAWMMDGGRCARLLCRRGRPELGRKMKGQRGCAKVLPPRGRKGGRALPRDGCKKITEHKYTDKERC